MHAMRLPARSRIGSLRLAIEAIQVVSSRRNRLGKSEMVASFLSLQRHKPVNRGDKVHFHLLDFWRPDPESAPVGREVTTQVQMTREREK